ncbi:hypothetical protein MASR1M59_29330 [Melaminivora sp.]
MTTANLLVELFVEELPPKALQKLGDAFASVLHAQLVAQGLAAQDAACTAYASPRRLAAHIAGVLAQAPDKAVSQKLMPVAVGLAADGQATPALLKKLAALGADAAAVANLKRVHDGKAEVLYFESTAQGATPGPRPAKSAGRSAGQAAHPQGHALPAARRLEQREFRAPGARPGGAARQQRGARAARWD